MRAQQFRIVAFGIATLGCLLASHAQAPAQVEVRALELIVEPPTLISLGFEWFIEATPTATRPSPWRIGAPASATGARACRCCACRTSASSYVETLYYTAPNMFAGSVFELAENTEYEVRFTLTDPDGVTGERNASLNVRTRQSRNPTPAARPITSIRSATTGPKQEPAFTGLLAAYYKNALGGDWSRAAPPRVQPGDTILVHAGEYKDFDRFSYSHEIRSQYGTCCGTPWDGTFYLTQDGTAERPIAIKAAGDGDVDLRRRRQQRAVQRHGRGPHVLRGNHVPQHRTWPSRPAKRASPAP